MMRLVLLGTEMRCVWQRLGKSEHCIWDELTNAPRLLMLQRLLYVKNYLAKFTKYDIQCNFQISISYDLKIERMTIHYNILQYSEEIIFIWHIAVWFWPMQYVIWHLHMDKLYSLYG